MRDIFNIKYSLKPFKKNTYFNFIFENKKGNRRNSLVLKTLTFMIGVMLYSNWIVFISNATLNGNEDHYDLIIITPGFFTPELTSLVEHKNDHGIQTMMQTTEQIFQEHEGKDKSEQIKYFIKNAKEMWNISYIMFVGSPKFIPIRRCNTMPLEDVPYDFTSELYYADIYNEDGDFSSWDSDGDELYAEWYHNREAEDDQQDLIPEIAIGRLECNTPYEVKNLVNKIIEYERQPANPSWFKTIVVAGGETFVEYEGLEGEIMTQNALDVMNEFTPVKLWVSNNQLDGFGINIIKAINRGCGFLYLAGHGNSHSWITLSPAGKTASIFTLLHLPFLMNKGKNPICLLSGCHVCKIEDSTCLGWQMTKKRYGGSIATIGPTATAYLGFEWGGGGIDWLELQFFKEYVNKTDIIGLIWQNVLTKYLNTYQIDWKTPAGENCALDAKIVQEWILLGDPSLKIGGYP